MTSPIISADPGAGPVIMAIANQKGGVGKTTTALGLAAAAAHAGRRVLIIDMDPQANASQTLLRDYDQLVGTDDFFTSNDILEVGMDPGELSETIRKTEWAGVDLIPSEQLLAHRDVEGSTGIEMRLRRVLKGLTTCPTAYDVVLLDCPPSVGRLTVNAFLAASHILLISGPDRYGHNALNQVDETLRTVRESYDHDLQVAGLVVNMFENTNEANLRTDQLRERFGDKVLMVMPKRTVLSFAAGSHQSVFDIARQDAQEVAGKFTDLADTLGLTLVRAAAPAAVGY